MQKITRKNTQNNKKRQKQATNKEKNNIKLTVNTSKNP